MLGGEKERLKDAEPPENIVIDLSEQAQEDELIYEVKYSRGLVGLELRNVC